MTTFSSFATRISPILLPIAGLFSVQSAYAVDTDNIDFAAEGRVRFENKHNSDFDNSANDEKELTNSRFRLSIDAKARDDLRIFLQPQFSKDWGAKEIIPRDGATGTVSGSSGSLNDTGMDVHQAFINYQATKELSFDIGRLELNYGDQLVVGGVGWHHIARSFDAARVRYACDCDTWKMKTDFFWSQINERTPNTGATSPGGEVDFLGLYSANTFGEPFEEVDVYFLYRKDAGETSATNTFETQAYGLRMKSKIGLLDYRGEFTFEKIDTSVDNSASERQWDLELGYMLYPPMKTRIAAEYFHASRGYDQLYPTGHKWLGYGDFLKRKNIKGFRFGASAQLFMIWMSVSYHMFERVDKTQPAFKFSTGNYGSTGDQVKIADELDVTLKFAINESLKIMMGYTHFSPGRYLDNQQASNKADSADYGYLQLTATM